MVKQFKGDVAHELRKIAHAIKTGDTHSIDAHRLQAIANDLSVNDLSSKRQFTHAAVTGAIFTNGNSREHGECPGEYRGRPGRGFSLELPNGKSISIIEGRNTTNIFNEFEAIVYDKNDDAGEEQRFRTAEEFFDVLFKAAGA